MLGVKRDEFLLQNSLPEIFKIIWGISDNLKDHSAIIRAITKPFSKMVLQGVLYSYGNAKGLALLIPPSLQENWDLHKGWINMMAMPSLLGTRIAIQKKITVI